MIMHLLNLALMFTISLASSLPENDPCSPLFDYRKYYLENLNLPSTTPAPSVTPSCYPSALAELQSKCSLHDLINFDTPIHSWDDLIINFDIPIHSWDDHINFDTPSHVPLQAPNAGEPSVSH